MIAATLQTGQLIVYVAEEPIDDATIALVKDEIPGAMILADLLEPLYDSSVPTRDAARTLGRVKSELVSMVENGKRVVLVCRRRQENLGTRSHFLRSLCASADRVHFLSNT
jgi:hypothetical protein